MIKFTKHFLKKLEDLLSELGFVLRYEKGNFQSGYCLVEHRNILVVNKFFDTENRIQVIIEIIQQQDNLNEKLMTLTAQTNQLAELMKAQSSLLTKWVAEQTQMRHTLETLGSQMHDMAFGGNEAIAGYLNQISVTSKEVLKKMASDHTDMLQTIRQEAKSLGMLLEHHG